MKTVHLNKKYYKILFFITAFIIFIFAIVNNDHIDIDSDYADKIKHITAFFTLSLLLNKASSSIMKRLRNMSVLLLFGIFIEIVQLYFPNRESSIDDIVADFVGILLFQLLYSIYKFLKDMIKKEE